MNLSMFSHEFLAILVVCTLAPMRPTAGGIFSEQSLRTKIIPSKEEGF